MVQRASYDILVQPSRSENKLPYPLFHPENRTQPPLWLSVEDFRAAFPGEVIIWS